MWLLIINSVEIISPIIPSIATKFRTTKEDLFFQIEGNSSELYLETWWKSRELDLHTNGQSWFIHPTENQCCFSVSWTGYKTIQMIGIHHWNHPQIFIDCSEGTNLFESIRNVRDKLNTKHSYKFHWQYLPISLVYTLEREELSHWIDLQSSTCIIGLLWWSFEKCNQCWIE